MRLHPLVGVRSSTRRLAEVAAAERALIVFSHDAAQWSALRTGAQYYD